MNRVGRRYIHPPQRVARAASALHVRRMLPSADNEREGARARAGGCLLFVFLFVGNIYWVWWLHDDGRELEREHTDTDTDTAGAAAGGVIAAAVSGRRRVTGVLVAVAVARRVAGAVRAPDGLGGSPGPVVVLLFPPRVVSIAGWRVVSVAVMAGGGR